MAKLYPFLVWTCSALSNSSWKMLFPRDTTSVMVHDPEKHLHYSRSPGDLAMEIMADLNNGDIIFILPVSTGEKPFVYVVDWPPRPPKELRTYKEVTTAPATPVYGDLLKIREAYQSAPHAPKVVVDDS